MSTELDRLNVTKTCGRCTKTKPLSEFHKEKKRRDGLRTICKECSSAAVRAWGMKNPERKREHNRKYRAANREHIYATQCAWRKANPDKAKAIEQRRRHRQPA